MSAQPLSERQREALREIHAQAALRAEQEQQIKSDAEAAQQSITDEFDSAKENIARFYESVKRASKHELDNARHQIGDQFNEDYQSATKEYTRNKQFIRNQYALKKEKIQKELKDAKWSIGTVYDSNKKVAKETLAEKQQLAETRYNQIKSHVHQAELWIDQWGFRDVADGAPLSGPLTAEDADQPCHALASCAAEAGSLMDWLQTRAVPRLLRWRNLIPVLTGIFAVSAIPIVLFVPRWYFALGGVALVIVGLAIGLRVWLASKMRRRASEVFQQLFQLQARGVQLRKDCLGESKRDYNAARRRIRRDAKSQLKQTIRDLRQELRNSRKERDVKLRSVEKEFLPQFSTFSQRRSVDITQAQEKFRKQKQDSRTRRDTELQKAEQAFEDRRRYANHQHANAWLRMAKSWKDAVDNFCRVIVDVNGEAARWFAPWEEIVDSWQPSLDIPQGIRIGALQDIAEHIPHIRSGDTQLVALEIPSDDSPALLGFPHEASLMFLGVDEGRVEAINVLQSMLLRCVTALPPGKVRCTIVDPVGRGENFAAFMHLADFDPMMITNRIWTESSHIDQRMNDLTDHMENVIQKYLRNQFKTLEEYNAQAGEMAEPFRFLVVANFPANFSAEACRRLVSLASSGARCGIYTFVSVDMHQPLPHGFELADLQQGCSVMQWQDGKFIWHDADFAKFPLRLDAPPDGERATELLRKVGERTREAGRVEVPFSSITSPEENWWTLDSAAGVCIPLGKAGAVQKQYLALGEGTAQHALIAGKTGSGKSTLLHALITQVALQYDPDQVELYLVDFKKGVEFKTYAVHRLPHARVVAVESEREFGLSVLKRLDEELKCRGELFRQAGASELVGYRQRCAGDDKIAALPRILLIVDEFQEFFVEEDKIAQEASLLLDRLVRQGRAFGIHVLLGSQTLGGAYSLARSTLDQMAVRIALQCSESDGHLILSKDNSAARLLSRPGEAIYNSANGTLEGNSLFQVVWLPDHERDRMLRQVSQLATKRGRASKHQIVFEGTAPSDLRNNSLLNGAHREQGQTPPWCAWLGEAVAIKEATTATFQFQSGANLLMVGQQPEAAFQMMVATIVSLVTQLALNGDQPAIDFLLGTGLESESQRFYAQIPTLFKTAARTVTLRQLPAILNELASEVDRRSQTTDAREPRFLILHGLQRMRDLRKPDDDFGFSRRDEVEKATPDKQFHHIITEGPIVGVFTLAWCDSLPNLNRMFDRRLLREFEMRVLFQMNANDSSSLIDDPAAAKLGPHRALFYTEDHGRLEKFRPYGLPDADWLDELFRE